jgi:hypothetical protein
VTGQLPAPTASPQLREPPVPIQQESTVFIICTYVLEYFRHGASNYGKTYYPKKTPKSKAFWIKDSILAVQEVQMAVLSNRRMSLYLVYMDIHTLGSYKKTALKSG